MQGYSAESGARVMVTGKIPPRSPCARYGHDMYTPQAGDEMVCRRCGVSDRDEQPDDYDAQLDGLLALAALDRSETDRIAGQDIDRLDQLTYLHTPSRERNAFGDEIIDEAIRIVRGKCTANERQIWDVTATLNGFGSFTNLVVVMRMKHQQHASAEAVAA